MFIFFIISILCKMAKQIDEIHFEERLSMLAPHASENGRNDYFEFEGQYLTVARTQTDFTQLGYPSPGTSAFLQTKEPIKLKNFKFSIAFELKPQLGGAGFGFWFSEKLSKSNYYGRNSEFKGIGIIIDTKKQPFVKFVSSEAFKEKIIYPNFAQGPCTLTVNSLSGKMSIKLKVGMSEYDVYNGPATVDSSYVFGISGSTGTATSVLKVLSIEGYSIKKIKTPYVKGETQKSNKIITLFGICFIGGLGYYLYRKQAKDFALKN